MKMQSVLRNVMATATVLVAVSAGSAASAATPGDSAIAGRADAAETWTHSGRRAPSKCAGGGQVGKRWSKGGGGGQVGR